MADIHAVDNNQASLEGVLDAATVVGLIDQGKQLIDQAADVWTVDMSRVERVSSSAVALLLEWYRHARQQQTGLRVSGVPDTLLPIIQISDLEDFFEPLFEPVTGQR